MHPLGVSLSLDIRQKHMLPPGALERAAVFYHHLVTQPQAMANSIQSLWSEDTLHLHLDEWPSESAVQILRRFTHKEGRNTQLQSSNPYPAPASLQPMPAP